MKVLITGGAGFIGCHLAERFLAQGADVMALDDLSTGAMANIDHLIGRDGFENLLSHAAFADVPFLLEVPGFDDSGPDKANVDILKELRAAAS